MKELLTTHKRPLGAIGTLIALVIALVYLFVVPQQANEVGGAAKLLLLYGHSLCWFLLAAACGLWTANRGNRVQSWLVYGALVIYVAFLIATLM